MRAYLHLIVLGCCATAFADPSRVRIYDSIGNGDGGEFVWNRTSAGTDGLSGWGQCFCIEYTEHVDIYGGTEYYVNLSNESNTGGPPEGANDPVSGRSAGALRWWFDLPQAARTHANANLTQLALWVEEEEVAWDPATNRWRDLNEDWSFGVHMQEVYQGFTPAQIAAHLAMFNDQPVGNVAVMQLWDTWSAAGGFGGNRQDQLIIIPAPAAAVLAVIGVGIAGWLKRQRA